MHIAIAGNIGSGKTTLTKMLSKHYNWDIQLESVEDNPYLEDFYGDMERWAFHLQIYFLNSRFNQVKNINDSKTTVIQDRTIYEDAYIFARNLNLIGKINHRDYQNYLGIFESMIKVVQPPDLLIYLKSDIPKLVERIQQRGRGYENAIRLDYLKQLNEHYEDWIGNYELGSLLTIDVNNMDFVKNVEDFSHIVEKVDLEINGLFSDLKKS